MAKLNIEGMWTGVLDVDVEAWTITMLREEIAKKSNCNPNSIHLMYTGKILNDGDGQQKLTQLGIKNNADILVTLICDEKHKFIKQEISSEKVTPFCDEERKFFKQKMTIKECYHQLDMIKEVGTALAEKHGDYLVSPKLDDSHIEEVERIEGKIDFNQRAIVLGLRLDVNAKRLIKQENFEEAKTFLVLAEKAFMLCDPANIKSLDNIPVLHVNMAWCYFMVQDRSMLQEAAKHLKMARAGIKRVSEFDHGFPTDHEGGLAFLMRLELLEGVVAYYGDRVYRARDSLNSAKEKYEQLRTLEEHLSILMGMDIPEQEAKRDLRMYGQKAIQFYEERERQHEIRRMATRGQDHYGKTLLNKPIDLQILQRLVSLGIEKELAVEALRESENDIHKSLDALMNPALAYDLQVNAKLRKRKREEEPQYAEIEKFLQMGFERPTVIAACKVANNVDETMEILLAHSDMTTEANPRASPSERAGPDCSSGVREVDALSGYGTDITLEGKAIYKFLSLVAMREATSKGKEKVYDY